MHAFDPEPNADADALLRAQSAAADRALIAAVQQGDVDAFRALHGHYVTDLLDFTFTYLRSRDDAEEVVQDLFLWIWEHRHEWNVPGGVRAYLFKAVRNRAINRLRQRRVQAAFAERVGREAPGGEPASGAPDALTDLTTAELGDVISSAVAELAPRCREVFLLVRERGLPYKEVAELLGISAKTVENTMNHALGALRRRVAQWRAAAHP